MKPDSGVVRRIGVFGGTFDPPHNAHIAVASSAHHDLRLDQVLMVVNNQPWQKMGRRSISSADDRLALVHAAVREVPGVIGSDIEVRRPGPSYSVDTLEELRTQYPESEFFLIVGADAASLLDTWERSGDLPDLAGLAIARRPGEGEPRVDPRWAVQYVDIPALAISSTDLRERHVMGRPLDGLVPPAVISEIRARRLYSGAE